MTATRFRGHVVVCTTCSHQSKAETLLVARQRDVAHQEKCDAREKQKAEAAAVAVAQGDLFGGTS